MKKAFLFILVTVTGIVLFQGCKNKNKNLVYKNDLIGIYKIGDGIVFDSTQGTAERIKGNADWTLSLMEKDNFEFRGHGKTIIGYWAFTGEDREPKNSILFQSGYMHENTIYARFDKSNLLFEKPYSMFDSAFQQVLLKRVDK